MLFLYPYVSSSDFNRWTVGGALRGLISVCHRVTHTTETNKGLCLYCWHSPLEFLYVFARVLEFGRLRSAGEGNDVADVLHTGDEQDETLETETESGVGA